jgi:hypothetical protein
MFEKVDTFWTYHSASNLLASSPCLIVLEEACPEEPLPLTRSSLAAEMKVDSGMAICSIFLTNGLYIV